MSTLRTAVLCAALALPAALPAQSPPPNGPAFLPGMAARRPDDGGVFRRALPAEPATLNPVVAADSISYLVYRFVFDPLLDMDKDKRPVGVLAESWSWSADKRTVTLKLRKGVLWHDGKPFTADDVLFTFQAIQDATVEAINKRAMFDRIASYKKVDDFTVSVTWKEPYAPGLADLVLYIVPRHVYGYPKGKGEQFNKSPKNADPVGTGPFTFLEWKRGESVTLAANPKYFRGRPHLDRLVFKIIPQVQTEYSAFQTGTLDMTRLTPDLFDKLKSDPEFAKRARVFEYPGRQYFYIAWNQDGSNPFFQDSRVRQALSYALNRPGILDKVLKNHALLCSGPVLPGGWETNPAVKPFPYDPKKAAALLDEAGWKDTNGDGVRDKGGVPLEFEVLLGQSADFQRWLEFFQQDLKKVGVSMRLRPLEWSVFNDRTRRHQFQAYLTGMSLADDPSPYNQFHSSQAKLLPSGEGVGENEFSYANPAVDKLLEQQLVATDPKERQKLLWRIHQALADDQPVTFLFYFTNLAGVDRRYQNLEVSPFGYGLFTWYPTVLDWWVPKEMQ